MSFFMWSEIFRSQFEEIQLLIDGSVPAWRSSTVKNRFDQEVEEMQKCGTGKDIRKIWKNMWNHIYDLEREDTLVYYSDRRKAISYVNMRSTKL